MLDIHFPLMLFVLALFLTLLVVLNKMLFQPLLKFMDDRDNTIANDLNAAKSFSGDSDELAAKADEVLSNAKSEATAIRQKAVDEAKEQALQKVVAKKAELDKQYEQFVAQLASQKAELKESLLSQVPQFKDSLKNKLSKI